MAPSLLYIYIDLFLMGKILISSLCVVNIVQWSCVFFLYEIIKEKTKLSTKFLLRNNRHEKFGFGVGVWVLRKDLLEGVTVLSRSI